jgi:hypothetical protein
MPKTATLALALGLAAPLVAPLAANAQRSTPDAFGGVPRRATLGVAIGPDSTAPDRRGARETPPAAR